MAYEPEADVNSAYLGRFDDLTPEHHQALSAGDEAYRKEWTETCQGMVKLLDLTIMVALMRVGDSLMRMLLTKAVRALDATATTDATSGWYV